MRSPLRRDLLLPVACLAGMALGYLLFSGRPAPPAPAPPSGAAGADAEASPPDWKLAYERLVLQTGQEIQALQEALARAASGAIPGKPAGGAPADTGMGALVFRFHPAEDPAAPLATREFTCRLDRATEVPSDGIGTSWEWRQTAAEPFSCVRVSPDHGTWRVFVRVSPDHGTWRVFVRVPGYAEADLGVVTVRPDRDVEFDVLLSPE